MVSTSRESLEKFIRELLCVTNIVKKSISKDAISQEKRVYHKSEVGIISEGVKDSGDVGVSAYLSANPKILNARGMVDTNQKDLSTANIFSTSAMLSPSGDMDDGKRL